MHKKLYHGAAFYPELWDEKTIEEDILMMKEAGINVVRMGEFAWSFLEPEEDKIDVTFFVSIINKLYENGIETIMCTPTPTPPIWLTYGHPERMYVDEKGNVMSHGSRQHICTNNQYFRQRAKIITEHIAKAVGHLPGVIGWQIDNEFKSHTAECMCQTCKGLWHQWLEDKYGTVHTLNANWGTHIWSEYYQSFEQIPQPAIVPFLHNSSLSTMYRLFSMEKIAEFSDEQAQVIRKYSKAPITHNGSFGFRIDHERLFKNLDIAGYDTYAASNNYSAFISNCDFFRNIKKGTPFWLMETSPCFGGSIMSNVKPHPNGYLKVEAVAAYALGGEAFCYWLWRQQRTGCEQTHGSIVSAWGKPTVGYNNVVEVERARRLLEPIILDTKLVQAEVAMTYSDRGKAFLTTESYKILNYRGLTGSFHNRLLSMGIHRDMIPEGSDLEGYKLLFTPFIPYISPEYLEKATKFVEKGGVWVVGPLTGGRTEDHTIHTNAALGALEELAGVETLYNYHMDGTGAIGKAFGVSAPLGMWSSVFKVSGSKAKAIGVIEGGISPGEAFLTECSLGKGKIVMLGSMPLGEEGDLMLQKLIDHYCNEVGVELRTDVTRGTIVVPRNFRERDILKYGEQEAKGNQIWVIINMDGNGGSVTIPVDSVDMLTREKLTKGKIELSRYEYRVIKLGIGDGSLY